MLELQDKLMGIQELLSDDRKAQAIKKKDVDLINEKNSTLEKQIET